MAFGIGPVLQLTQQPRIISRTHFGITKLAYVPAFDGAAELGRHHLHAIADTEHRNAF